MLIGAEPLFPPVEANVERTFLNEVLGNSAWDHLTKLKGGERMGFPRES